MVFFAGVAQLAEHLICNQRVAGSNPVSGISATSKLTWLGDVTNKERGTLPCPPRAITLIRHCAFTAFKRSSVIAFNWNSSQGYVPYFQYDPFMIGTSRLL